MTSNVSAGGSDKLAQHWKSLCLMSGAPECVIKAAHRFHIEIHHPDRGGTLEAAQRINVAYDELKGRGSKPNEHVAAYYDGEPWHVIGVASNADRTLVERAGKTLAGELTTHPRLAARVEWAITNFGRPAKAVPPRPRATPPPPARRRATTPAAPRSAEPVRPGIPDGLPGHIDMGTVDWGAAATREVRLTWKRAAPYNINVSPEAPLTTTVTASKALPGRFVVTIGIDWESDSFAGGPTTRGYTLDSVVTLRWPAGGEAHVRVKGVLRYPAIVTASPFELDLGTVLMNQPVRASLMVVSTAATNVEITASTWLARVDAGGRRLSDPLKLSTNVPVRVAFDVQWPPIAERASKVARGKPVRPTGKITVRWNDQQFDVPVQIVVQRR